MRVAFLGTPEVAVRILDEVLAGGHEVSLVVTRADRRRGRGGALSPSAVKARALELGLPVTHDLDEVRSAGVERAVVVAYGRIVPSDLLDDLPMLNVHFSCLPRWRGAAPVERAILAGDTETGVAIMSMDAGLDTGPVHLQRSLDVGDDDATTLRARLAELGASALLEVLGSPTLLSHAEPQRGEPTYAHKITRRDRMLRLDEPAELFVRRVRIGGGELRLAGQRLFVEHARVANREVPPGVAERTLDAVILGTLDGAVQLDQVRPEGGATMSVLSWWRGRLRDEMFARWESGTADNGH